jgi:hypothetical protein
MLLEQLSLAANLNVLTYRTIPATCSNFEREITKDFKVIGNVFPLIPVRCSLSLLELLLSYSTSVKLWYSFQYFKKLVL